MKLSKRVRSHLVVIIAIAVFGTLPRAVHAQVNFEVIAITNDPAPTPGGSTNGVFGDFFGSFGNVSVNDSGKVLFTASGLDNTANGLNDNSGLFLGDSSGVVSIARRGQTVPGVGTFSANFSSFVANGALNEAGEVAFSALFDDGQAGVVDPRGVFSSDGSSLGVNLVALESGTSVEGSVVTIDSNVSTLGIIDDGSVTFAANNIPVSFELDGGFTIFNGVQNDALLIGGAAPNFNFDIAATTAVEFPSFAGGVPGTASINDFGDFDFNNRGEVAFGAETESEFPNGITSTANGLFTVSDGEVITIAQANTPAPNTATNGEFGTQFSDVSINDAGQIVFLGSVNSGSTDAIFFYDETNGLSVIALEGDALSSASDLVFDGLANPVLNEAGQILFEGSLPRAETSLILADAVTGELTPIFQSGDPSPDGDGVFDGLSANQFLLNDNGQVAFRANLDDSSQTSTLDEGVFVFDEQAGLTQVFREGRSFLDDELNSLDLGGFNNRGQVALEFVLDDRRSGVVLLSPVPEPSSFALLFIGAITIATRRRKS